jgi:hypothetical protein
VSAADAAGSRVASQVGGLLLTETVRVVGLDRALSAAHAPCGAPERAPGPTTIVLDLAVTLTLDEDCLADIALLRVEPGVCGRWRRIRGCRARSTGSPRTPPRRCAPSRRSFSAWVLAGSHSPDHGMSADRPLLIDMDATLVTAHSEKEGAAPTFKKGFGHHPLVDLR